MLGALQTPAHRTLTDHRCPRGFLWLSKQRLRGVAPLSHASARDSLSFLAFGRGSSASPTVHVQLSGMLARAFMLVGSTSDASNTSILTCVLMISTVALTERACSSASASASPRWARRGSR